jgi:hypothetical protein
MEEIHPNTEEEPGFEWDEDAILCPDSVREVGRLDGSSVNI